MSIRKVQIWQFCQISQLKQSLKKPCKWKLNPPMLLDIMLFSKVDKFVIGNPTDKRV